MGVEGIGYPYTGWRNGDLVVGIARLERNTHTRYRYNEELQDFIHDVDFPKDTRSSRFDYILMAK